MTTVILLINISETIELEKKKLKLYRTNLCEVSNYYIRLLPKVQLLHFNIPYKLKIYLINISNTFYDINFVWST